MQAREIMSAQLFVVTGDDAVSSAAALMRDNDVGLIPVVDDRARMHLAGVITDRDITVRCVARRHGSECRVHDHMTSSSLITADPEEDTERIVERMSHAKVRRVPVIERERLVGIITQADIATKLGPSDPATVEQLVERVSRAAVTAAP